MAAAAALAEALLDALPQTQCTRCGYADCRGYAEAMAAGAADVNRCPPGGAEGVERLARIAATPVPALNPECGSESPRSLAVIDEAACIGCALCLKACPPDAILGAAKRMHTVVAELCTGCELCLPVCPVDCISLVEASSGRTGWSAWSLGQAGQARRRYDAHRQRFGVEPDRASTLSADDAALARREAIAAAVARARSARSAG
jgi:Na+-translocating ferredoxin:NAD+ oxidoreductase subunit B